MKNKVIIVLVSAVVGFGIGYYFFHSEPTVSAISTSTSSTFSTAKIAETGFAPTSASATTSTTLLNTDSTDRIITDEFAACSGVATSNTYLTGTGLAALTFTFGTTSNTSNSNPATSPFTITIATSSPNAYTVNTSDPSPTVGRVWASGTYLLINANATNTASCVAGVHYLAS